MKKQGGGTIINISSGAATGALEGWSQYCSTKAAVLSLTKCVHKEEAAHGIRMIGLSPGTVATEMQVQIKSSGIKPGEPTRSFRTYSSAVGSAVDMLVVHICCGPIFGNRLFAEKRRRQGPGRVAGRLDFINQSRVQQGHSNFCPSGHKLAFSPGQGKGLARTIHQDHL